MGDNKRKVNIAVIGCGFMGTAILQGLIAKADSSDKYHLKHAALVRSPSSSEFLSQALGSQALGKGDRFVTHVVGEANFVHAAQQAHVIILGFPPDQLAQAFQLQGLTEAIAGKLIISLLAGVSSQQLLEALKSDHSKHHLIRAIPSIGAKINASVTLLAEAPHATLEQRSITNWLFTLLGQTIWLPESQINDATALGAVCHALAVVAVDGAVDGSVAEGLPRRTALKLAAATLQSAAGMMLQGGMTPESLKEAMSVPRGITINAVRDLGREGVGNGVAEATGRAIRYTRSMAD